MSGLRTTKRLNKKHRFRSSQKGKYTKLQAENKRLRDFILLEIEHAEDFVEIYDEPEKINMLAFIRRAEQALKGK